MSLTKESLVAAAHKYILEGYWEYDEDGSLEYNLSSLLMAAIRYGSSTQKDYQ